MIAVDAIKSDIAPVKSYHLNRRGKLTRNKLRRVSRSKSSHRHSQLGPVICSQLKPVPPATSHSEEKSSAPAPVGKTSIDQVVVTRQSNQKLPTNHRKSKSGDSDRSVKLPHLKNKEDGRVSRKGKKSTFEHDDAQKGRRQSLKTDSAEDGDKPRPKKTKSVYILEAIKPNNVQSEKEKFMRLRGQYDPQFEYHNLASEKVMKSYSQASNKLVPQATRIMENALDKYGSYEAFEEAIAGNRLTENEFSWLFKEYVMSEGMENQVHLNLTPDLLSRAVMTRLRSRPTMNVNCKVLREGWAKGLLQHEIGTHYIRSANNRYQPWHNNRGRKRHGLLPMNPTEEGLASLHSVLGRSDPCLWRSAMLYYTVYQASLLPFRDLFEHLGRFIRSPEVRWDYCMRAKRGQVDTTQPGCFNKDQVYLNGALQILRFRYEIDFHALVKLGRVAFQDVERLRREAVMVDGVVGVPSFMADRDEYLRQLNEIRLKNKITDKELAEAFPTISDCF